MDMGTDTPQFEPLSDDSDSIKRAKLDGSENTAKKPKIDVRDQRLTSPKISPFGAPVEDDIKTTDFIDDYKDSE